MAERVCLLRFGFETKRVNIRNEFTAILRRMDNGLWRTVRDPKGRDKAIPRDCCKWRIDFFSFVDGKCVSWISTIKHHSRMAPWDEQTLLLARMNLICRSRGAINLVQPNRADGHFQAWASQQSKDSPMLWWGSKWTAILLFNRDSLVGLRPANGCSGKKVKVTKIRLQSAYDSVIMPPSCEDRFGVGQTRPADEIIVVDDASTMVESARLGDRSNCS